MNIKEGFLNWISDQGKYKGVNIESYIDRYVYYLGFDPFEVNEDFSNADSIKNKIRDRQNELKDDAEFVNFNNSSQNGVPSAILGKENYSKYLDQSLSKPMKDRFKKIIDDFRLYLKKEDSLLKGFSIAKTAKTWFWISDNKNTIGITDAHYEIIERDNKLYVEIHFEGKNKKDTYSKLIENIVELPDHTVSFPWSNSNSIRYNEPIDYNDLNITNNLVNQIIYFENYLGDKIRNILISRKQIIEEIHNSMKLHSLNQILFGPPGTGKTYNTINKAIEIISPEFYAKNKNDYDVIHKEFDRLLIKDFNKTEGQIAFCTFHQTFTYEDFVEGIKPLKPKDGEQLKYDVQAGVFKKICELASEEKELISLENAYESFKNEVVDNDFIILKTPTHEKPFRLVINSNGNCIATPQTDIKTEMVISKAMIFDYLLNENIRDWKPYLLPICNYIKAKYKFSLEISNNFKKPYVLIIDEINRGNVSSIFGELITLIELNKRKGEKETLEVILPYSKQPFTVPANLYIIGTMNTADRSVEALDAALRRRFSFEEMPSKPKIVAPNRCFWELLWKYKDVDWDNEEYKSKEKELLELLGASSKIWDERKAIWEQFKTEGKNESQIEQFSKNEFIGINFESILEKINLRIEKLLDKDHQIGHSYFMCVTNLEDLKSIFHNKIIPLLQEYFFGDYGKIGLVLGESFVSKEVNDNFKFATFKGYENQSDLLERPVYTITNSDNWDFKSIYE